MNQTSKPPTRVRSAEKRFPLDSFDPRFGVLLKAAALRNRAAALRLEFPTRGECMRFQQRLFAFRAAARRAAHPDCALFARVRTARDPLTVLWLYAHDTEDSFESAFSQVGIAPPVRELSDDPLAQFDELLASKKGTKP